MSYEGHVLKAPHLKALFVVKSPLVRNGVAALLNITMLSQNVSISLHTGATVHLFRNTDQGPC